MRKSLLTLLLLANCSLLKAAIIEFDISPPGTGSGVGLHPANEVIPGPSSGSGNETGQGIFFDTDTGLLALTVGYGSAQGFKDLTGPAFAWLLHGPSTAGETAPALFDLQPFHTFAADPARGGQIFGTLRLNAAQKASLLAGLDYINIYTSANLGGELRGQLMVVPEPSATMIFFAMAASALLWTCATNRLRSQR